MVKFISIGIFMVVIAFTGAFFWSRSADFPKSGGLLALVTDKPEENRFIHPNRGFSFDLPKGFEYGSFPDENGELLVFEKNSREGFQIYITPFDEEGPLTPERIQQDLPSLSMTDVKKGELDSISAVVFQSSNESLDTFEVWFLYPESPIPHGNYLYQILTYREYNDDLSQILQTWKFGQ